MVGRVFNFDARHICVMGRAVATRGQRKIGRIIRKLETSVEFSPKENKAKMAEQNYKQKVQTAQGYTDDSPIQNLRDPAKWKKDKTN